MEPVSRRDLDALASGLDAAVERDAVLDPFCTRSVWQLGYHDAFEPRRSLWLAREGDDWVLLAQHLAGPGKAYLEPLENMWGFGSPMIGKGAAKLLARSMTSIEQPVLLLGLPLDRDRLAPLSQAVAGRWGARALEPTTRLVASLEGGLDGWLSRRTPRFRRNLRAVERRVRADGIAFRRVVEPAPSQQEALYARVLAIEAASWKAAAGRGADLDPMRSFYDHMWRRLLPARQLRLLFAERDGRDVGYLHGAVVNGHFRGLQFSFDETVRDIGGVGNALQFEMLRWIAEEAAQTYDLGAHSDYKRRWAEEGLTTFGLFLQPLS